MLSLQVQKCKLTKKDGTMISAHFVNTSFSKPNVGFVYKDGEVLTTTTGFEGDLTPEILEKVDKLIQAENDELNLSFSF